MKYNILIIGPLPPPYIGPAVATKMILASELNNQFKLIHLDTSDHRSITNIGKLDLRDIFLAILHIFKLLFLLIKYSPRIIYLPICQTVIGYFRDVIFIVLSKVFGVKVIIHLRGGYFRKLYEKSNPFVKIVIRSSLKLISRAIVLGKSLRYIFEGLVPSERIGVVPNGIERDYITNAEFEYALCTKHYALSTPNQPNSINSSPIFRILFLSNLMLSKGFFDVIKSIPLVTQLRNNPITNIQFLFAGEFHEEEMVKSEVFAFIKFHNLSPFVKFVGRVDKERKKELLLSADILVFPTYYYAEGQPWVIIEAMAAGLPIITTDMGCIKEMVIDGENGFIIEKKNPAQIAQKVMQLLENVEMRKKMGKASRARFLKYYTKDRFLGRLGRVFSEVLSNP